MFCRCPQAFEQGPFLVGWYLGVLQAHQVAVGHVEVGVTARLLNSGQSCIAAIFRFPSVAATEGRRV